MNSMSIQTEFDFILPKGFVDTEGKVWNQGVMRLATALDEISVMEDPRVQINPAYLPVLLLAKVICRLGDQEFVTPNMIENLFASDLTYLEDLYMRLNCVETVEKGTVCPKCSHRFQVKIAPL